ncbi:hypothetical protein PSECIP111951_00635 [Pseudoalteromonas holothuriae]|uniref:Tetratricopeptide repeat protein n=1 Tax=Pseudoalteromonas holothuriae TaxID=2963714 RepID=A0ABM9GG67_9GAMM|nr:hypothetical protein [Pseudoalteromonas sp. CIP111951]CAH9052511.1 hypothetical protein PSECIP111951_00635 [Pseudoalteromonas sp. CIP111951]
MEKGKSFSPKEFLKSRRPERFSDSIEIEHGALERPLLEYYLATLNTRSQELEFEGFAKKLCEKIVCPNLLEQTGPVAGGDGKTDTQTYPVSEQNKLLWYEGINDNSHKERWAFAVSTRKDWKAKCKEDVKKISETKRGYTRAFCITNQSAKSDQRSQIEDRLSTEFNIKVTLFDLSWILDQIYKNKFEFIAIETLNIPTQYKREVELGASDYKKARELERLKTLVNESVDASNVLGNQVDYFLDIAILSKELESAHIETQGYFDRAIRVSQRFGSNQQILESLYQYAWAAYWWFEDFQLFEENLEKLYKQLEGSLNATKWELLVTLITVHIGYVRIENINPSIDIESIISSTIENLSNISNLEERASNALKARINLCLLNLTMIAPDMEKATSIFVELLQITQKGEELIGFPFDSTFNLISELDFVFEDIEEYEKLLDYLTEQSSLRIGDIQSSRLSLNRGLKRLDAGKPYQAIKHIGKSLIGLNKEECVDDFTIANFALSSAYSHAGLHWASRACLLWASSILADRFWKKDEISPITVRSFWKLAWSELTLGRIVQSIKWLELTLITQRYLEEPCIPDSEFTNFDGCLGHNILNFSFEELKELEFLPDTFDNLGLYFSYGVLLFVLGHIEKANSEYFGSNNEEINRFLIQCRDTDIGQRDISFSRLNSSRGTIETLILGCKVNLTYPNRSPFIEMSEAIVSSLEGFLSTGLIDKLFTKIPYLDITVIADDDEECSISHEYEQTPVGGEFVISCSSFSWGKIRNEHGEELSKWFSEFLISCLSSICVVPDIERTVEMILVEDLAISRSVSFNVCFNAVYNIMGNEAQSNVIKLVNGSIGEKYCVLRSEPWDSKTPKNEDKLGIVDDSNLEEEGSLDFEKIRHDKLEITRLIKPNLWDQAKWNGLGYITSEEEPPYMMFIFNSTEGGTRVFQDLYEELGQADKLERLRISVIRGISKQYPCDYRIQVGENVTNANNAQLITMISRIHEMSPQDNLNWERFEASFKKHKCYKLSFGIMRNDQFFPFPDFQSVNVFKKEIIVKHAWEVGVQDIESSVIRVDDDPITPEGTVEPPVEEVINTLKNKIG